MKISVPKVKVVPLIEEEPKRSTIVINDQIIEQVITFKYFRTDLHLGEMDVDKKIVKLPRISGLIIELRPHTS